MLLRIAERTMLIAFTLFWLPNAICGWRVGRLFREARDLWEEM